MRCPFSPERADIQAQAADPGTAARLDLFKIPVAKSGIEPGFPGFICMERAAGERMDRTDVHALRALPAPGLHGLTGRDERCIGQHGDPPYPRAMIGGDKQAVLSNPAEAGQVRCQFLREDPRDRAPSLARFEAGIGRARYPFC